MSVRVSTLVWDITFPTQSQKLVALKLADHANDDGASIYPAVNTVAEQTGCGRSTVFNVLKVFVDCGLLVVVQEGGKGPKDTTVYQFNVDLLRALSNGHYTLTGTASEIQLEKGPETGPIKSPESGPFDGVRVQPLDLRVQPMDEKGPAAGPKPSLNHQEPSARERAKNFDGNGKAGGVRPAMTVTANDPSWRTWLGAIRNAYPNLLEAAEYHREIEVDAKWPENAKLPPRVKALPRNVTGEAA